MKRFHRTTAILTTAAAMLAAAAAPVFAADTSANDPKALIGALQEAFQSDPEKAKATFGSSATVIEGFRTEATMRHHKVTVDFTEGLGGGDAGPSPVELVLASLGTCQAMTYQAYAVALGIPVEAVQVEVEGDLDLRGFLAVDDSVRPGFQAVRMKVHLVSGASGDEIEMLRTAATAHCPLLDIVENPVPVDLSLEVAAP